MSVNPINRSPYYDDYSADKNFHRILFRPGYAVQARELTQHQTILQDQIKRFGDHVFKSGSLVTGGEFHINNAADYVKIESSAELSSDVIGKHIENSDGVRAKIIEIVNEDPDYALIVKYLRQGGANGDIKTFGSAQTISVLDSTIEFQSVETGKGSIFKIDEGVIYSNGAFIRFPDSKIVVSPFSTSPTADIGFFVNENIVNETQDSSILDNATGSPNFAAPGAHRLQYILSLAVRDINLENSSDFVQLYRVEDGEVSLKYNRPQYADLMDELANRTYEEAGHYALKNFSVNVSEHLRTGDNKGAFDGGDANKLLAVVSPGTAYVKGHRISKLNSTRLEFEKSTATNFLNNQTFTVNIGNFVLANELSGSWCNDCGTVSIRDAAAQSITNATYSSTAAPGTEIGTAKLYSVRHETGTGGVATTEYRIYLFDIRMTSGSFSRDAKSLVMEDGPTRSLADLKLNSSNEARIYDRNVFPYLYKLSSSYTQRLRDENGDVDTSFEYVRNFSATFSSGSTNISITESNESFPFGDGVLSATELQNIIVTDSTGQPFNVNSANQTSSTGLSIQINDNNVTTAYAQVRVRRNVAREARKIIRRNRLVKIDCATAGTSGPFNLGFADIFNVNKIYVGDTYDTSNPDMIDRFSVDDGQRDTWYEHGSIRPTSSFLTGTSKIVVDVDYFDHDFSQGLGYISVDSYPIDDSSDLPDTIKTWEVPSYGTFNLINYVDIRKKKENTANDTTVIGDASINPIESSDFDNPAGGARNLTPDRLFVTDLHYYLAYYLVIGLNKNGEFVKFTSSSTENPVAPVMDKDLMHISTIKVNPYPSLAPNFAKSINRQSLAIKINTTNNRRYTMADLRSVDKRLDNVEYYTSLTLLEKDTKDMLILDQNDNNRFKNGFFVDSFTDHNVGDYKKSGYSCAIDPNKARLLPSHKSHALPMMVKSTTNTNLDT